MLTLRPKTNEEIIYRKKVKLAQRNRGKGRRAEVELSVLLSNWYGQPESFARSQGSGAGKRIGQPGDIQTPPNFLLCIESKNSEGWELQDFLASAKSRGSLTVIWSFWQQSIDACNTYNSKRNLSQPLKYPCVILKKSRYPYIVILAVTDFETMELMPPEHFIEVHTPLFGNFIVCLFEDLLDVNKPPFLFSKGV